MSRGAWGLLLMLLALQAALAFWMPARDLVGDEPYYVQKAMYIVRHGHPPDSSLIVDWLDIEIGSAWGNSDWRPQGYPALVTLTLLGGLPDDVEELRMRVTAMHFVLLAIAICMLFALLRDAKARTQFLAALLLGIAPWPYAFLTMIGPDSPTASIAAIGLVLLYRRRFVAGALLVSFTLLLRPEMLALAPCAIAVALLLHRAPRRAWALAAAAFLAVVGVQVAYRAHFVRGVPTSIYAPLRIYNGGLFAWVHTWIGTEHEAYDFVYALNRGDDGRRRLPDRAFANEDERRIVDSLRMRVRSHGFNREIDREFAALAEKRKREHPISANLLPRLWRAVHLWVNLETNEQLAHAMTPMPRALRRPILGALLALKLALLAAFAWRGLALVRDRDPALLFAAFVVGRTVLMAVILNWMAHRYALTAWLPLLATLLAGNTRASPVARGDA